MDKKSIIWLLALSFTFLSCSDNDVTGAGDKTAPAAISDLAIVNVTNSSLELSWTAPGDDGNSGTAKGYDLRYSTTTLSTEIDWQSAIEVSNEPTPRAAGTIDSAVISGLTSNVKYYIGLKSVDEAGNWSALSNIAIGTTTPDTISPAQITDLVIVDSTSYGAVLTWTAPGDDGSVGMATRYNVKRDTVEITDANWNTAVSCSGIPIPSAAGEMDSMRVTGLKSNTHYYFGVRASDEQNNWSDVSVNDDVTTEAVAVIADLAVVDSARNAITLTWTAPGDAAEGPYVQYDIRYSISAIDPSNWNQASQCKFEPMPGTAGTTETFLVTGLRYDTTHYFAIKSADSASNWSAISNIPSGKTKWSRFAFPRNYGAGYGPSSIISAHLNADNCPDLAVTNYNSNSVTVFMCQGDIRTYGVRYGPRTICAADFNGDNDIDLAVAYSYNLSNLVTIISNNGVGRFQDTASYSVGYNTMSLIAFDFDGDNDNDLAAACFESDRVFILENNDDTIFVEPHERSGNKNEILVVDPNHRIFTTPDTINIPPDGIIQLYTTTSHLGINFPSIPLGVVALGRETDDANYYPLAIEDNKYVFWGFNNPPSDMTQTGKDLLLNIRRYLARLPDTTKIAYIYSDDSTGALEFKSFLDSNTSQVDLIHMDLITGTVFSSYNLIVIGSETGYRNIWGLWQQQVLTIYDSNKPIIGLGEGGYAFFGKIGLDIGYKEIGSQFRDYASFAVGDGPYGLTSGDLDNDGDSDIVVSNMNSNNVSVLLYDGLDSTFMPPVNYAVGSGPTSVFLAEFNSDANLDLAVVNTLSNDIYIMLNNGDGSFSAATSYPAGDGPRSVFASDLNNDGFNDLAVTNINSDSVSVYLGNGDGSFQSAINYWAGEGPISVVADFIDTDAYLDLVVANNRSKNISILKNMTATR